MSGYLEMPIARWTFYGRWNDAGTEVKGSYGQVVYRLRPSPVAQVFVAEKKQPPHSRARVYVDPAPQGVVLVRSDTADALAYALAGRKTTGEFVGKVSDKELLLGTPIKDVPALPDIPVFAAIERIPLPMLGLPARRPHRIPRGSWEAMFGERIRIKATEGPKGSPLHADTLREIITAELDSWPRSSDEWQYTLPTVAADEAIGNWIGDELDRKST